MGSQSFFMFDDRKIQFFCDNDDATKRRTDHYGTNPYKALRAHGPANFWPKYEDACLVDSDCWKRSSDKGQRCTKAVWEYDNRKGQFNTSGYACYSG